MKKRLDYLDSIRGFAALAVAFFHYILFYREEIKKDTIEEFFLNAFNFNFDLGKIAVLIFFMLSGYVITYSLKGTGVKTIKSFCVSRFFRLYPTYWLSLLLGVIYFSPDVLTVLFNITMLQQFFGVDNVIGLYWTLQLEMIFYFLIIVLVYFNFHKKTKTYFILSIVFLLLGLIMAFFRMMLVIKLPVALPLALSLMCFGSLYKSFVEDSNHKNKVIIYLVSFAVLIPIISRIGYNVDFGFHENWLKYLISYYLAVVIFLLLNFVKIENRIFIYLGKISYSIYLFHPITYKAINSFLSPLDLSVISRVIIHIFFLIIVASITYHLVEKYSIVMGKRYKKRIEV